MTRRLVIVASALSLLICMTTAVLWARTKPADAALIVPLGKHLAVQLGSMTYLLAPDVDGEGIADAPAFYSVEHEFLGFQWVKLVPLGGYLSAFDVTPPMTPRGRLLAVPFWFVVLSTGLLPMITAGRILKIRRRILMGRCAACAYDLRASKIRCPECGTPIPSNATAGLRER